MPPPPVAGAPEAAGTGLAADVTVTVTVTVGLAVELAPALAVLLVVAPLDAAVGGEWVPDSPLKDDGDVQPATATAARMANTPKPMTVSFALKTVPAMVTRSVMGTPLMRLADGDTVSQVLVCQTGFEKGKRAVRTSNGVFTIGILGYASRRLLGRRREGRTGWQMCAGSV